MACKQTSAVLGQPRARFCRPTQRIPIHRGTDRKPLQGVGDAAIALSAEQAGGRIYTRTMCRSRRRASLDILSLRFIPVIWVRRRNTAAGKGGRLPFGHAGKIRLRVEVLGRGKVEPQRNMHVHASPLPVVFPTVPAFPCSPPPHCLERLSGNLSDDHVTRLWRLLLA